jgi:hypothetical protein
MKVLILLLAAIMVTACKTIEVTNPKESRSIQSKRLLNEIN